MRLLQRELESHLCTFKKVLFRKKSGNLFYGPRIKTKVKVRSYDGDTDFFEIVADMLEGSTLAPYLFIICLDNVFLTSIGLIKEKGLTLGKARSKRYPAQTMT